MIEVVVGNEDHIGIMTFFFDLERIKINGFLILDSDGAVTVNADFH